MDARPELAGTAAEGAATAEVATELAEAATETATPTEAAAAAAEASDTTAYARQAPFRFGAENPGPGLPIISDLTAAEAALGSEFGT